MNEPKGATRIFLRRIMPSHAGSTEPSEEDKRKSIISLQNGKSFGRGPTNDVIFLDGTEIVEREPQLISRLHARIHHEEGDDYEVYYIEDHSENGTYLNDRRLQKNQKAQIRNGDILKFGHKDGHLHAPGETVDHSDADFAFRAMTALPSDLNYPLLEQNKDLKVKIHIGSPFVEEIENRPSVHSSHRRVVQQQEADSTNENLIESMEVNSPPTMSSSASDSSASTSSSTVATSSTSTKPDELKSAAASPTATVPNEDATTSSAETSVPNLDAPKPTASRRVPNGKAKKLSSLHQMPSTSQTVVLTRLPKRAPHAKTLNDPLHRWFFRTARSAPEYIALIKSQAQRILAKNGDFLRFENLLHSCLDVHVAHEDWTTKAQKLEVISKFCLCNQKDTGINEFESMKDVLAGYLIEEEEQTTKIREVFTMIDSQAPTRQSTPLEPLAHSENSLFKPPPNQHVWKPEAVEPLSCEVNYIRHLKILSKDLSFGAQLEAMENDPARDNKPLCEQSINMLNKIAQDAGLPAPEDSVMGDYTQLVRRVIDVMPESVIVSTEAALDAKEVDEERHSASSGSTESHEDVVHNFRRRTDSEESEIDVVGTDDDDKGTETDTTPTPSPEEIMTLHKLEEDSRKSSTPRIDAQSTPSAVVSAGVTPMASPIPKSAEVSVVVSPSIVSSTPGPSTPSTSNVSVPPVTPAGPESASDEAVKQIKLLTITPTKPVEEASKEGSNQKKQKEPRRMMKQLDESSADSESDDDVTKADDEPTPSTLQKKKNVRRSTRTVKASSPIKRVKKNTAEEGGAEEGGDGTPRVAAAKRKAARRTGGQASARKRDNGTTNEDDGEAPKKKRGRSQKKATPPQEADTTQGQKEDEVAGDPLKEKCGAEPGMWCLSAKYEKRKKLEWVECSECNQWFHVFCVRLDNRRYKEEETFACCGPSASPEALKCLEGKVSAEYFGSGKRPIPASPDR